ncbi:MAG TPA: GtrA family protein [Burkholderiaceae bacterium]|nr:GtrA family protein [Burkholderiaceae bacterium]
MTSTLASRLAAYTGVGAIGTVVHYLTLILLVEAGGMNSALAAAAGAGLGAIVNYTLNYHYTFRSGARHLDSVPKFAATAIAGMLLSALIVHMSVRWGAPYLAGQVLATGVVLLAGFASSQFWVFRKGGHGRTD